MKKFNQMQLALLTGLVVSAMAVLLFMFACTWYQGPHGNNLKITKGLQEREMNIVSIKLM